MKRIQFKEKVSAIPEFCLPQATDSTFFCETQLASKQPVVLMYFHPECELCQSEIQQVSKKAIQMENIQWILVSNASRETVNAFAETHGLLPIHNMRILIDTDMNLCDYLQLKSIPSCFVYNRRHRLVKVIYGLVRAENIIALAMKD
jgi:peroxiredoxin